MPHSILYLYLCGRWNKKFMSNFSDDELKEINRAGKRKKARLNKIKKNAVLIGVLLLILIISSALLSPIFDVKNVIVSGTFILTDEKVIEVSKIEKEKNTFLFRTSSAEELVSELSFIDTVNIKRKLPSTVLIEITECKPIAQISLDEAVYLVVDKNRKILDSTTENLRYAVPTIENVNVSEFSVGELLTETKDPHCDTMLTIVNELNENDMLDNTKRLYYEDSYQFEYANGIICDLEKGKEITYKIKFLKEAIANIPEGKKGILEFVDDYKAVFKPNE